MERQPRPAKRRSTDTRPNWVRTRGFAILQRQWYMKLKETGFHDAEILGGQNNMLIGDKGCISSTADFQRKYLSSVHHGRNAKILTNGGSRYFALIRQESYEAEKRGSDFIVVETLRLYGNGFRVTQISDFLGVPVRSVNMLIKHAERDLAEKENADTSVTVDVEALGV